MSGNESSSSSDMEVEDVAEGANIRVVQSSMHASIIRQNSLFKVVENKKESDKEDEEPLDKDEAEEVKDIESEKADREEEREASKSIEIEEVEVSRPIPVKPKVYSKAVQRILADPPPKKAVKIDVEKRFYEYKAKVEKKIEKEIEDKNEALKRDCTFVPKINKHSDKRNFEQFLRHVNNFEKLKNERIEKTRKEKDETETPEKNSFKPTLSEKTIKLTSDKSKEAVHERLYSELAILQNKHESLKKHLLDEKCSFKPKLTEMSDGLKREGETCTRLYQSSKEKAKEPQPLGIVHKLTTEGSETIISTKLNKLIEESLPGKLTTEDSLNYSEFLVTIEKIRFIHPETEDKNNKQERELASKAWEAIGGQQDTMVSKDSVVNFLKSVINLDTTNKSNKKLHLDFFQFYQSFKGKKKCPDSNSDFAFRPVLDPKSEKMAASVKQRRASNLGNGKIENILVLEYNKAVEKLEARRKEQEEILSPDCTFQPKITRGPMCGEEDFKDNCSLFSDYIRLSADKSLPRNELLYNFSRIESERKEKQMRTLEDLEFEKNMGECSFVPSLDKPKFELTSNKSATSVRGVNEVLERLKKARGENGKEMAENPPMKFGVAVKSSS